MTKLYSIRDWQTHFECAQSKKVTGPLSWFPMPTKHDGLSFRRIMARTDGPTIYTAWVLLLAVAAKCPVRGRLADTDGPLTPADLELKTGCKSGVFEAALNVLASKEIGWVLVAEWESNGSKLPLQDRTEQDKDCCAVSAELGDQASAVSEFVFPVAGRGSGEWTLPQSKLTEYVTAYPSLDVKSEMRKAVQWCIDNPRNRKTASGMFRFLTGWLNRIQNRGGRASGPIEEGYKLVTAEEFTEFVRLQRFKEKPTRHTTNPNWVFGTLRDGSKVECKTYPVPTP